MAASKRPQTISKGLKVTRTPRRRSHPRASHGLKMPRNPRRGTQSRVFKGFKSPRTLGAEHIR
eukprot:5575970-Pyramimonas_sp.AAC.1